MINFYVDLKIWLNLYNKMFILLNNLLIIFLREFFHNYFLNFINLEFMLFVLIITEVGNML